MILLRQLSPLVASLGPAWLRRFLVERIPVGTIQRMLHISDTLHARSNEIFREKKSAVENGKESGESKDIISILCACLFFVFLCGMELMVQ